MMKKQRMEFTLIAAVLMAVVSGGPGGPPPAATARQFVAVATAGDPRDGFGAEAGGGGYGDPTDGEDGDPTDGEGRTLLAGETAGRDDGFADQGDPGDGEEAQAAAGSESLRWWRWLELVRAFTGLGLSSR
ncbi:MAG: hypothetical protein Q8N51_10640 [Gammaproteobacteria bacterium]|nr:hypothetical protein [Gammaproteobacteria bacterium]